MEVQSKKILKPRVAYKKVVPRSHTIVGGFAGLIIILGIIESWFFFKLSLLETAIITAFLLVFYAILLVFLLKPKLVKVVHHREVVTNGSSDSMSKQIAKEIVARPVVVNINNQTKPSKKKAAKKKAVKK